MRYRIERIEGQHCHFVNGRKELLAYLKHTGGNHHRHPQDLSERRYRFCHGTVSAVYEKIECLLYQNRVFFEPLTEFSSGWFFYYRFFFLGTK